MALIEGSGMVYWCFLFLRVLGYISGAKLLVDFIWFIVQRFGTNVQINYNINNNNNNNDQFPTAPAAPGVNWHRALNIDHDPPPPYVL